MSDLAVKAALERDVARPLDKLILVAIAWHADKHGANAYPAMRTLAGYTAAHERTVRRAVQRLTAAGHLRRESRRTAEGRHASYRYSVPLPAIEPVTRNGSTPAVQHTDDARARSLRTQVFAMLAAGDNVDPSGWRVEDRPAVSAALTEYSDRARRPADTQVSDGPSDSYLSDRPADKTALSTGQNGTHQRTGSYSKVSRKGFQEGFPRRAMQRGTEA
ncbi:MAG: helix-turn-helix domain-containing protein [Candidatus Dormibacteria bacterium]